MRRAIFVPVVRVVVVVDVVAHELHALGFVSMRELRNHAILAPELSQSVRPLTLPALRHELTIDHLEELLGWPRLH